MSHPLVYELNTRCRLRELSEAAGAAVTLADVPDAELDRWQRLGFTHVWLMGVWAVGPRSRAVSHAAADLQAYDRSQVVSSPYAIAEYRVAESLGGDEALRRLRQKLHARGLKLLLDFVPNHVGLDHSWVIDHPEWLVHSTIEAPGTFEQETRRGIRWLAHGRDPNFPPWIDTVQLDYRQPELRAAMRAQLLAVADHCDGVRCDMAMLILNDVFHRTWKDFPADPVPEVEQEFWPQTIAAVKRTHPDFLFLAEVYWDLEARLQSLGFDYTYDKTFYDHVVQRDPAAVQRHLLGLTPQSLAAGARFLENHDELRIAAVLNPVEHRAAASLLLALPGLRLLHEGQLEGARIKVPVQFLGCRGEPIVPDVVEFYEKLLAPLRGTPIGHGQPTLLTPGEVAGGDGSFRRLVAVRWHSEPGVFAVITANLASEPSRGEVAIGLENRRGWRCRELWTGEDYALTDNHLRDGKLRLELPGHGWQWLQFQAPT